MQKNVLINCPYSSGKSNLVKNGCPAVIQALSSSTGCFTIGKSIVKNVYRYCKFETNRADRVKQQCSLVRHNFVLYTYVRTYVDSEGSTLHPCRSC